MEGDALPTPPSTALSARLRQQQQLQLQREQVVKRSLTAQGAAAQQRDAWIQRSPPRLAREGERTTTTGISGAMNLGFGKTGARFSPPGNATPRALGPVTERKSQEEGGAVNKGTRKGNHEDEKWEIAPDGSSAGREGRQFTVANVGNNGRIYLRPTVRPANQRYPQPHFAFPVTPPSTAGLGLDAIAAGQGRDLEESAFLDDSLWTPSIDPATPPAIPRRDFLGDSRIPARPSHRRALSDSTVPDTSIARESDPGGFKIVITQPGDDQRPRTVEDLDRTRSPLIDINIPSWRIGTPRFSMRGTAFIRGSSYAPTEDVRSSSASVLNRSPRDLTPDATNKPGPIFVGEAQRFEGDSLLSPRSIMSPRPFQSMRSTYMSTYMVIEPDMFDALTFKPACDDRAVVRYAPTSGTVTAATPPRLVAEITSPSFLDYELLSDFFLTFRSFLEPSDLLRMLLARLRWALARDDEIGLVVRVRTFVALRHWILNYFVDDFVVDYSLRVTFCNLLNDFVDELSQDAKCRKVQIKILGELKKCWRRVCSQYWDGPQFDSSLGPDVPISPGGIAGHRNPDLDPSFWEKMDAGPPQLDGLVLPAAPPADRGKTSFYADVSRAGHIDSVIIGDRPATPENPPHHDHDLRGQASPTSILSMDVVSCSFPSKNMRYAQPGTSFPLAAHPVDPSSMYMSVDPIATTPRALTGKRIRPSPTHKRNASLTDSLRDHATVTEKVLFKNAEFLLTLPYAGSLVRGNLFPPGQPFVEVQTDENGGMSRQTTIFQHPPTIESKEKLGGSAMSGQGMKKLLGSVRRALSSRGQVVSPTQGNFINISPIGPRGATTNRLPGTAIVPQARPRQNGVRPPVRIDLLGAEVAEDFKKAVREDAALDAERAGYMSLPAAGSRMPADMLEYSEAHMNPIFDLSGNMLRPMTMSDDAISTGSKSIVIVDATMPTDLPAMTGALPAVNPSVEHFAETFMPNPNDPTPPNTPPGQAMGTPRRSSYILSKHVLRPSLSADPLPPLASDLRSLDSGPSVGRPSEDNTTRPSFDDVNVIPLRRRPPLSGVRGHARYRSRGSNHSAMSFGHRRHTSYTSGTAPRQTVESFDATTYSGASVDDMSEVPMPQPLRVLRRRPGGDLRAVTNAGELNHGLVRRSRSVGSLTTFSESVRSSFILSPGADSAGFVNVVDSDYSPRNNETFSLGAMTEQKPKRTQLSLFSTHSSKPIMRPSFEVEAQKLAQIPDDVDDDGGVEAALLKLEGKFEKKSLPSPIAGPSTAPGEEDAGDVPEMDSDLARKESKREHRHVHLGEEVMPSSPTVPASSLAVPSQPDRSHQSFLSEDSRGSYSSIPLLDRDLAEEVRGKRPETKQWTNLSILQGPDDETPDDGRSMQDSQHPSYEFVKKTESMEVYGPIAPKAAAAGETSDKPSRPETGEQSFLDIDSEDESDLSSELSDAQSSAAEDDLFPNPKGAALARLPIHPLGENPPNIKPLARNPPSPPMTLAPGTQLSPLSAKVPTLHDHQLWEDKPLPPTPDTTPTVAAAPYGQYPPAVLSPVDPTGTKEALRDAPKLNVADPLASPNLPRNKFSVHLPFILAFDSDVLAQQFTLIEKDALNEIDWKELIEMRWKNAEHQDINARSWVAFLRDTDARGVEVVIARFNLMVKWAVSEIVLTQDLEERARCVIKYIHIAAHCRRYRNFATMSQLTIALTSNEVGRLSKTWALVPASDMRTLQDLEALISPTRNFWNLRAEMEGGGVAIVRGGGGGSSDAVSSASAEMMGCIPFVGIYTHDLLFNAQRPSEIASSPTGPPLVNFERCRTAASVVKTLLRLLEASTLYDFQPIEGITERCLWMGALSDEEIRRYGEGLE